MEKVIEESLKEPNYALRRLHFEFGCDVEELVHKAKAAQEKVDELRCSVGDLNITEKEISERAEQVKQSTLDLYNARVEFNKKWLPKLVL